jgi:hypothetical protein
MSTLSPVILPAQTAPVGDGGYNFSYHLLRGGIGLITSYVLEREIVHET